MLYACTARFDVTGNLEKFFAFLGELNKAQSCRLNRNLRTGLTKKTGS